MDFERFFACRPTDCLRNEALKDCGVGGMADQRD